jgi:hypothetical protein
MKPHVIASVCYESSNKEHKERLDKMNLPEAFDAYLLDWEDKLAKDEWYFCNVRESLTNNLSPSDAFDDIPDVVDLILRQSDDYIFYECLLLLLSLARISNTTEIPPCLLSKIELLNNHTLSFKYYNRAKPNELKSWYRIEC